MPEETQDAKRARKLRAGRWLLAERERRGLTQTELAQAMGLPSQNRISNYENGVYEIKWDIAKDVARVFGMREVDVFAGLEVALPDTITDDDQFIDYVADRLSGRQMVALAQKAAPELMTRSPRPKPQGPGRRPQRDTRSGERMRHGDQGEQSAV